MATNTPAPVPAAEDPSIHLVKSLGTLKKGTQWILAVGAMAVLAGSVAFTLRARERNERDQAAFDFSMANTPEALQSVINTHAASPLAALAQLQLGAQQFNQGDYELALRNYEAFLAANPGHALANAGTLGRLMCLEALGRFAEALEGFAAFDAKDVLYPQAQFGRARCLEKLDRLAEARDVYVAIGESLPDTIWASQAMEFKKAVDLLIRRNS
jgi:tetratricopeptide (TPR) repeat protein